VDFDSLLKKEFGPKTDEAKEAVERASDALPTGVAQTTLISADVSSRSRRSSPQLDVKLTRANQPDPPATIATSRSSEGAWRGLHHLVSNTEPTRC
jgi:type VI secretion system protein ImpC